MSFFDTITIQQRKGIDIVIRMISRKYPFIVGWDEYVDYFHYTTLVYVDLIIDCEKFGQFFNVETNKVTRDTPTPSGYECLKFTKDFDLVTDTLKKISNSMRNNYDILPEEYRIDYTSGGYRYFKGLGVGDFRYV